MGMVLYCTIHCNTVPSPRFSTHHTDLSRGCPKEALAAYGARVYVGEVASLACWKWRTCMFTGPAFHVHKWRPVSSVLNCLFSTPLWLF